MTRCINLDWIECYCIEDSIGYPHNADYFRQRDWEVKEREYGTPMYTEMFTLYNNFGEPMYEIRRNPKSDIRDGGLFDPNSCHVRLSNATCYTQSPARNLAEFLELNGFGFQRISRVDIALDFEKFDYGDDPAKIIKRYMQGRYSKINQANLAAHGLDAWDGRTWNSLSWGSKNSMVTTKLYNKTKELKEVKDKPYIRQAWQLAGLVDNMNTLEKTKPDGTTYKPNIWRVEFSVKSGTKGWFVVEDYNGDRKRLQSYKNTLQTYYDKEQILQVFFSLAHHYFHFKHVEYKNRVRKGAAQTALDAIRTDAMHPLAKDPKAVYELQRKDRCADKVLFNPSELNTYYQIEKVCTTTPKNRAIDTLLQRLLDYRQTHYGVELWKACDIIIAQLEAEQQRNAFTYPYSDTEVDLLRRIIAKRISDPTLSYSLAKSEVENLQKLEKEIWSNPY